MTATVTTLQNAIKARIEAAHAATPFVPSITVRVAEQSSAPPMAEADLCDIVIGYEASALIGATATKRLEQYLIPIKVRARCVDGRQDRLATLHALTERLRDLAQTATFSASDLKGYFDQLIQPHPFDMPTAMTPGVFDHRFVCDIDVVRTISAPSAPSDPDPLPLFTRTRRAVWSAINNWPAFTVGGASVWSRKFQSMSDVEEFALRGEPHASELPAIAVTWGPTTPEWWVNVSQNWPQQLFVETWYPAHQQEVAERRLIQLVQAMQQAAPPGATVSYIRAATGRPPSKHSPITFETVPLGRSQQAKAIKGSIALTLTGQFDPTS